MYKIIYDQVVDIDGQKFRLITETPKDHYFTTIEKALEYANILKTNGIIEGYRICKQVRESWYYTSYVSYIGNEVVQLPVFGV